MFPDKSSFSTILRKTYGKGYEALRLMIMHNSPLFDESPGDHVRSPPNQPADKTLSEYYIVFKDYLAMSALVNNSDLSLDDPQVIDMFIFGTLDYNSSSEFLVNSVHRPPVHTNSEMNLLLPHLRNTCRIRTSSLSLEFHLEPEIGSGHLSALPTVKL
jgi:hypothetical protein